MDVLDTGPLYDEIGQLVARDIRLDPEGTFLYAEIEHGMIGSSIFKDVGAYVVYRDGSEELVDKMYELWLALDPDKRWATMSYTLSGGRFDATFEFPDDINPDELYSERRPRVLTAKYGDKRVDYSDP